MLYTKQELKSCIFFDIETMPQYKFITKMPQDLRDIWDKRYAKKFLEREVDDKVKKEFKQLSSYVNATLTAPAFEISTNELYVKYSPLQPEFGKVLCISFGILDDKLEKTVVTLSNKEFLNDEVQTEKKALEEFRIFCDTYPNLKLAGFNIKGFDIPFLIKRYLILNLQLPKVLQLRNKKPWEVNVLDIMEDWKGMGWDLVALETLALTLGLKSPKTIFQNDEMNLLLLQGSISIDNVIDYCERDVNTTIDIALRLSI